MSKEMKISKADWKKLKKAEEAIEYTDLDGDYIRDREKSKEILLELVKKYPDELDLQNTLAVIHTLLEEDEKTLLIRKSLVEKDPSNSIYHYNLGIALWRDKDHKNAQKHFDRAVELEEDITVRLKLLTDMKAMKKSL